MGKHHGCDFAGFLLVAMQHWSRGCGGRMPRFFRQPSRDKNG